MKTNDLISLLTADAPVRMRLGRLLTVALVAGVAVSTSLMLSTIGLRPDMGSALDTARVLLKVLVTLALAVAACSLVFRIGRPGVPLKAAVWSLLLPCGALVIAVVSELAVIPKDSWRASMMGHHAGFCVFFIPILSLMPLAGLMIALRQGAPESPKRAGAAAGLAAGGIAAAIYAWHCPDDSPLFVAAWYSLAIAAVACVGAALGGRVLRW